jgi:hypothetical protein
MRRGIASHEYDRRPPKFILRNRSDPSSAITALHWLQRGLDNAHVPRAGIDGPKPTRGGARAAHTHTHVQT